MNWIIPCFATLLVAIQSSSVFALVDVRAPDNNTNNLLPYREGRMLVKINIDSPDDAVANIANDIGAQAIFFYTLVPGLRLYEFDESISVEEAVEIFSQSDLIEFAEPDYWFHAAAQNDPRFPEMWQLENVGQTGGLIDADINANTMWAIEQGSSAVVVGVIDSGVDYNHNDLNDNMWRNLLEIPGNGIDDDGNGYTDDVFGINAIANTGNPLDDNAHGTHCAGTIGAEGNNSIGVVGIAQDVRIAACKFLGANGSGSTSDAIQCLQYFANLKTRSNSPVNIVATNNSWGSTSQSAALNDAIKAHQDLGILFVAAAGNSSVNADVTPYFPASYEAANVISVAATDHADRLATFSNYGRRNVHLGAPGVRILSTVPNQSYALFSGTSMAAPHVSGMTAIVKARFPSYDYKQIKNLIISSGTPLASLQNTTISGRRLRGADANGRGALTCVNQIVSSRLRPIATSVSLVEGQSVFLSALRAECEEPAGPIVLYSDGDENVILQDAGTNGDVTANDGVYSLLWEPQNPGNYALDFGNGDVVTIIVGESPPAYRAFNVNFAYEAITGTSLSAADETIHTVNVPFRIRFNGHATGFQTLYVSSNGTISFTTTTNPGYLNQTLPTAVATTLVAPYWDDLIPTGTNSNIYVATTGTAPNRKFIVEWRNMRHYNATGVGTFQTIFYENSSDIRFNYLDTNFSNVSFNSGRSATVGVQSSPTVAEQYSFNLPNIPSSSSLLFRLD